MTLEMRMQTSHRGSYVFVLKGQIEAGASQDLEDMCRDILKEHPKRLLLDMSDVDYIMSLGIRIIFDFSRRIHEDGGIFSMYGLKPNIARVFQMVRAIPLEKIFPTIEEADDYIDKVISEEAQDAPPPEEDYQ